MRQKDFDNMSVDELWVLHEKIGILLVEKIAAEKRVLESRLSQLRQASHVGRNDPPRERKPYPHVRPKFYNPDQPSETWTGRGKTPRWLTAQLETGKQIDDFRIDEEALELT